MFSSKSKVLGNIFNGKAAKIENYATTSINANYFTIFPILEHVVLFIYCKSSLLLSLERT